MHSYYKPSIGIWFYKIKIAIMMEDRDGITVAVTTVNLDDGY